VERKRLVGLVIAVVVVVVVIIAFASGSRVQNASQPAISQSSASNAQDEGWKISTSRDPMNDAQNIDASIQADNQVQAWLDTPRPVLHVRCSDGKMSVYVWTGTAASVESGYDGGLSYGHKVTLRFDNNPEFGEDWAESDDNKELFEMDEDLEGTNPAHNLIVQMVQAKTLLFQFTPFNANPVIAHFDVEGLSAHIDQITKPCNWSVE
jgi:type VI secretion system protein VasI